MFKEVVNVYDLRYLEAEKDYPHLIKRWDQDKKKKNITKVILKKECRQSI